MTFPSLKTRLAVHCSSQIDPYLQRKLSAESLSCSHFYQLQAAPKGSCEPLLNDPGSKVQQPQVVQFFFTDNSSCRVFYKTLSPKHRQCWSTTQHLSHQDDDRMIGWSNFHSPGCPAKANTIIAHRHRNRSANGSKHLPSSLWSEKHAHLGICLELSQLLKLFKAQTSAWAPFRI